MEELAECEYHMQPKPVVATITAPEGIMRTGHIGKSQVRIVDARPAVERTLAILKKDRFALCAAQPGAR